MTVATGNEGHTTNTNYNTRPTIINGSDLEEDGSLLKSDSFEILN